MLAFEPVSELFDARPTGRGLTVVHGAVGGEEKEILIHKSLGTDASSKFKLTEESLGDETVDGYSLERVFSMITDKEISLVKVDIEGSEIELFGFASDYIIRRSKQYSVEFHDFIDPSMIDDINILFARMKRIGYYRINFSRGNGNVLFVRKDCISIFNYIILNFVIRNVRGLMRIFRRKLSFRAR
ncbi:FkbM family methyltransferase [Labrys monachus]|uniref:FkbM family methyltransferase n=1 Tax=Labrys monachus TaxID=217067 RepID=A0ABU0FJJ3_9HYPH|nr:FkbM family methyltransferase [Labrys monachus]